MNARELKDLLRDVPDCAAVVGVEYHKTLTNLGPDEWDEYGGLPTGAWVTLVRIEYRDGMVWVDYC